MLMINNDNILLDGIIDDIITTNQLNNSDENRGKVFEEFAVSELLKTYDLTHEQILDGLVDGGDDGGIDGLYFFVNGNYISDKSSSLPKTNAILEIYIITCKHHDTYALSPLESMDSSLTELFNLGIKTDDLKSKYKTDILKKRELLVFLYRKLAPALMKCSVFIRYISRGIATTVADNIIAKGKKIEATCSGLFLGSIAEMQFIGSKELMMFYRNKRNGTIELNTQKVFQNGDDFVALVRLSDYFRFITDSEQKLKRYFFEENVRDYLGANRTNTDIMDTLSSSDSTDFWLYNNGITILASRALLYDRIIEAENIQIVNGLQTTNSIYNYFISGGNDDQQRSVLVKIIVSTDTEVRKKIIQATNNQSLIPLYSLHATDKIQKDIEDTLYKNNLYYERKDKYYQNMGIPKQDVLTPLYLASGFTSLILKLPHRAVALKSKFMNKPKQYSKIFNEHIDIRVWINIAKILKATDRITPLFKGNISTSSEKYLKSIRPIVSLVATARVVGKFGFGINDLIRMDIEDYTDDIISDVTRNTIEILNENNIRGIRNLSSRTKTNLVLEKLAQIYNLSDFASIERRNDFIYDDYMIDDDFLEVVKNKLPSQPWPNGIHKVIATELGCSNSKVSRAINALIAKGMFKQQTNNTILNT